MMYDDDYIDFPSSTTTEIAETTEGNFAATVTGEVLTTINTLFEEFKTSTEPLTSDTAEPGMYIRYPTTSPTTTMETVPIYQISASSKPGSITEAILGSLGDHVSGPQTVEPIMDRYEQEQEEAYSGASSVFNADYATAAIIMAGSYLFLNKLDGALKNLYSVACYRSDPRLIATGHREDTFGTRMWARTATFLEWSWLPLWFSAERLREDAVDDALEQIHKTLRNHYRGNLQPEIDDMNDFIQDEREVERLTELNRQLQYDRQVLYHYSCFCFLVIYV